MARITLDHVVDMDYPAVAELLEGFIRRAVAESGRRGVVVGVSGGVDSATTLALAAEALGPNRVLALIMPDPRVTPERDVEDAKRLARQFGVDYRIIDISKMVDAVVSALPTAGRVAVGNVRARLRMVLLYLFANEEDLIVLGTGDRSEFLIGYFTKYGDGAADIYPISVLYKSQVRRLALELGVPKDVAFKPSAPRLWPGHEAERELGLSYEQIDLALFALFDLGMSLEEAARETGLGIEVVRRVWDMHVRSRHKRACFEAPDLRDVRRLWRGYATLRRS